MKLIFVKILSSCFICLVSLIPGSIVFAQSGSSSSSGLPSIKTSQMSDQQIMQLWQQAQQSGMSENDAMNALLKRGLDPSEITSFKKRLNQLQGGSKSARPGQVSTKDTVVYTRDSNWIRTTPVPRKKLDLYGYDFFTNANGSTQPAIKVTTPRNYILGADDELNISITGLNEASFDAKVNNDGYISIPYAGLVAVSGLTIDQASTRISNKLSARAYPGLQSGASKILLSLTKVRSIRITFIGEALKPGANYIVSPLASFVNVLYTCGGPSPLGSLRKIELIRNNKVIDYIDLYSFLQNGTMEKNIRLEDQDIIRFPLYKKRVHLNGEVKRPATYELLENETIADLLKFSGGLSDFAIKDVAKIEQTGDREMKVRDIQATDFGNFILKNADSVYFDRISTRYTNRVILTGAVNRAGTYELTNSLTLSQLIKKADGLSEGAFLNRGYIKRINKDGDREQVSFNTSAIVSGAEKDIALSREDSVFILLKDNLLDVATVTIGGDVRMPTTIQYRQGLSVEDAIAMAGGFTLDAANHKVEISRLERNKADTLANKLIDVLRVDVDSSLHNRANPVYLQPLDYVFVPKLLNYRNLGNVKIRGEVLYDGDYALERRNETVQELIQRAGGISPLASMSDVQVYRNGLRVSTNLLGDDNRFKKPFLLLPDDSIYIPKREDFVEVKGEVFNPQILSFESGNFMTYISGAGGTTDKGNLKKAYIQYSNGINNKIHHFLFFRRYPKVLPGSKIFVPEKTDMQRKGLSIFELASLTGSLSALVGLISILKK